MVDFTSDDLDLDINPKFKADDLDLDIPSTKYSRIAGLDVDTRLSDVARDRQDDVRRLYDVFEDNPEIVEVYKTKLNRGEAPVIDNKFIESVLGPDWYKNKEAIQDLNRFRKLTGLQSPYLVNPKVVGSYPPTSLKKKFYLDDRYDVYNRGLSLTETENIPYVEEKMRALGAGLEKGAKGIGLTITEMADVVAGTEFTDWLDENWETVDTGGGFNKVLDVFGQFGLGYGAGLKVVSSIRKLKLMKRGKTLQAIGLSPRASKIAGRMGYYSLPALVGDAAVMNLEDKQFGEMFNAYSVGNPDLENLTNREKALERLKRKGMFGFEGFVLSGAITGAAKPVLKAAGKVLTTKVKDLPKGAGKAIERSLVSARGDAFMDPMGRVVAQSSIANIPLRLIGSAMNATAVVSAPLLGWGAKNTLKLINKSGLPPFEQWRFFSTTADSWGKGMLRRIDNVLAHLRTSKHLFRDTFDLRQLAEGETRAINTILRRSFNDIDKEIRGGLEKLLEEHNTKSPQQFEHIVENVVEYLKGAIGGKGAGGRLLNQLPKNLREPSLKIYKALRTLREEAKIILKDEQHAYDDLLNKVKEHFNISYRAFRNPRYRPSREVRQGAISELTKVIKEQMPELTETQAKGRAKATVNDILELVGTSKGNSLELLEAVASKLPDNFPVARPGEVLPDVIKKLLGGPKDARTMLMDVVTGLSESIWKHHLHDTMYRTGVGRWIFDNANALIDKGISNRTLVEISPTDIVGKNTMFKIGENAMISNPKTGKKVFVTPEMKKALIDDSLWSDGLLKVPVYREFLMLKAGSQYSKTVLSLMTQVRNVTSAFMFPMANGHIGGGASYIDAYRQIVRDLFGRTGGIDSRKLDELGAELERVGILNSSVMIRDMKDMFRAIADTTPMGEFRIIDDDAFMKFLTESPIMKKLTDLYQAGDIIHKIYGYQFSKSQYKAAFQNLDEVDTFFREVIGQPFDRKNLNGTLKTLDEAIQEAAGKTLNNTYPNYNYIPELVKNLRRMPFGNFISFGSEMLRTTGNIANYAIRELGSSNPYIRQMGAKRIMGLTSVFAVAPVSTAVALKMLGMTEEQLDAVKRNNTAPWNQFANLIPYSFDPNKGEVKYINLSYSNPYEIIQQPLYTMIGINEQSDLEKKNTVRKAWDMTKGSFSKLMNPFVSEAIIGQAVAEALNGETRTGRKIYNLDKDGVFGSAYKMFNHVLTALVPTTFVNLKRVEQGAIRQDDAANHRGYTRYGKPVDLKEELLALFGGIRLSKVNVFENISFTVNDFNEKLDNARAATSGDQYRNLDYNDKILSFIDGQKAQYAAYNEMALALQDAAVMGQTGDPTTEKGKKEIVQTFNKTMKKLLKEIEPRITKKEYEALEVYKRINDEGEIETYYRGTFLPLRAIDYKGDAAKDAISEIEGATLSGRYPMIELKRIFNALKSVPLGLSETEFQNIINKSLGLPPVSVEEPKIEKPASGFTAGDLDLSQADPSINMITPPQTIAATPQVATSAVPGTDQGLTPTEMALLSPDEQLIKLRQNRNVV